MEAALQSQLSGGTRGPGRQQMLEDLAAYAGAVVRAAREQPRGSFQPDPAAMNWIERPVFVCGHHRSGTTLLQELLDGHPELVVLPSEGTYFSSFRDVARADPAPQALDAFAREWVSRLVDPNYSPHFKLGLSTEVQQPYVDFVARLFAWQAALQGAYPRLAPFSALLALAAAYRDVALPDVHPRAWVEKTPLNERHLPQLLAFEHARFIHVVRHPADSFVSLIRALEQGGVAAPPRVIHAADIGRSLELALANRAAHPERYLVVRYEDLTDSVDREMERVREFLGIREHETLTRPTSAGVSVRANSSFDRGAVGVVHRARDKAAPSIGDAELLAAFAGSTAPAFGYELPAISRMRRTWLQARHAPVRALHGLRDALR